MDRREDKQVKADNLFTILSRSLTEMLWNLPEEGVADFEEIIESLAHDLLAEGPEAFKKFKDRFPPNAEEEIMKNQTYQDYLKNKFKNQCWNPSKLNPLEQVRGFKTQDQQLQQHIKQNIFSTPRGEVYDEKEVTKSNLREESKRNVVSPLKEPRKSFNKSENLLTSKVKYQNTESKPSKRNENLTASKIGKYDEKGKDNSGLKFNSNNMVASSHKKPDSRPAPKSDNNPISRAYEGQPNLSAPKFDSDKINLGYPKKAEEPQSSKLSNRKGFIGSYGPSFLFSKDQGIRKNDPKKDFPVIAVAVKPIEKLSNAKFNQVKDSPSKLKNVSVSKYSQNKQLIGRSNEKKEGLAGSKVIPDSKIAWSYENPKELSDSKLKQYKEVPKSEEKLEDLSGLKFNSEKEVAGCYQKEIDISASKFERKSADQHQEIGLNNLINSRLNRDNGIAKPEPESLFNSKLKKDKLEEIPMGVSDPNFNKDDKITKPGEKPLAEESKIKDLSGLKFNSEKEVAGCYQKEIDISASKFERKSVDQHQEIELNNLVNSRLNRDKVIAKPELESKKNKLEEIPMGVSDPNFNKDDKITKPGEKPLAEESKIEDFSGLKFNSEKEVAGCYQKEIDISASKFERKSADQHQEIGLNNLINSRLNRDNVIAKPEPESLFNSKLKKDKLEEIPMGVSDPNFNKDDKITKPGEKPLAEESKIEDFSGLKFNSEKEVAGCYQKEIDISASKFERKSADQHQEIGLNNLINSRLNRDNVIAKPEPESPFNPKLKKDKLEEIPMGVSDPNFNKDDKITKSGEKPLAEESKIDDNTLEGAFERVRREEKLGCDTNFTLVLDFSEHKQIKKDKLILSIIDQYRDKSFTCLFHAFRPFLFDLLKRREGFEDFLTILRRISSREKISAQKVIKSLEVRDLIALLLESCSPESMARLGLWLANHFYPMPIFSRIGPNKYISNLGCCSEVMFQARKKLITSIGTKNSLQTGKSSLLSYMFSTRHPSFFSTQKGFTHAESIDLYSKLPQDGFEYIVADVNGYVPDRDFQSMISKLLKFSHFILIHVVLKDVEEDMRTGRMPLDSLISDIIPKKTNFMVLFRDYDEYHQEELIEKIQKSLKSFSNYCGIVPIPKLDDEQSLDTENQKSQVMDSINQVLLKLEDSFSFLPILELRKASETVGGSENQKPSIIETELDEESRLIGKMLNKKIKQSQGKNLYQTLFPCFWTDFLLSEERKAKQKMEKNHINEEQFLEFKRKYEEIEKRIKSYEEQKSAITPSDLIVQITLLLSSKDTLRVYYLSETIDSWKMPLFKPLKTRYLELCVQKKGMGDDLKSEVNRQMKQLENEMDDKDISLDTFLDEIHSLYEAGKQNDIFNVEGVKEYLLSILKQGAPVNLVNGKTLKFGSKILKDIFRNYDIEKNKVYVISIIGSQSSAKSTLLNVLFGCGFATSAGRCTKGLYITLLKHPNGNHFLIIDTEGLLSVVARDHEFDNLITTMAFSCSNIVIINNKGELNSKLRDLLEICVYAMKHLKLTNVKPKIIFALRDIADDSLDIQREMVIHMKASLQQAGKKLLIDIEKFIEISEEDVFLLPSAFQLTQANNGSRIQTNNNLFSLKVLDMRNYIFKYLATMDNKLSLIDLKKFYDQSEQLWNDINGYGKEIMKARNFLEIELKDDVFEKINQILKKYDEIFLKKGRALLDYHKGHFQAKSGILSVDVVQLLTKEFNKVRDMAFRDLDKEVINNEKYEAVSSYHREFRETLEYYLGWQRQNLISEWRSSVISYECSKQIDDFRADLKSQVDKILQSKSGASFGTIIEIFNKIRSKSSQDFILKMDELRKHNISKLAPEIQGHYECAQHRMHQNHRKYTIIPTVAEFIRRIEQNGNADYDKQKFIKKLLWSSLKHVEKVDDIHKEFQSMKNEIKSIVPVVSSEEVALRVMQACVSRIAKMEINKLSVDSTTFMHSCLLEAMFAQYTNTKDNEVAKIQKIKVEHEAILQEEEKHIKDLLDLSKDNRSKGETIAKRCYRDIQKAFCSAQEIVLQDAVMKKIREEFPTPESANQKAYKDSFEVSNYVNVVKYVLNINKFISEIYQGKIRLIADFEIERRLDTMRNNFISVIQEVISVADAWSKENEMNERVDLSTLYMHVQNNPKVVNYFPDFYIVQLSDTKSFNYGFKRAMSDLLANFDLQKEIKENIKKKIDEYLSNQYSSLVGCQARCPICNNKCIKPDTQHKDHHTDCHLLTSFSGIHRTNTREVILRRCFDPENYKGTWEYGDKKYTNFDDYLNAHYSDWRAEFPTKKEHNKHETNIPSTMMKCWVGTKDVLIKYYDYVDKTPPAWEKLVPLERRLPKSFTLEGYTDVEEKP